MLLYNFCAFALQMPLGLALWDKGTVLLSRLSAHFGWKVGQENRPLVPR